MFAFCFGKNNFAALRHNHNVGIMLDIAIDRKAMTGNIPMPPTDIGERGQFHNQILLQAVHIFLGLIERAAEHIRTFHRVNCHRQTEERLTHDFLRFKPLRKGFLVVLRQQTFYLGADFRSIAKRGFFHCGKLRLIHIAHNAVNIGLQFGSVHHVQLVKLFEHHFLALAHSAFGRQIIEILLEVPLICA